MKYYDFSHSILFDFVSLTAHRGEKVHLINEVNIDYVYRV